MATNRLQIRLDAIDNTKKAFGSIKNSIFSLKGALAGLGLGLVVREFVKTGQSVEDLQVRLKQLFGSAQEGAKAFDVMSRFAGRVPFSLEEIQAASGNLAVVAGDANRLSSILEITGNVAAVTGLDFRTASEQIQRSFAGGIAAADIFREKGVRDMLGFKAGATVTAEETVKAFERVFGKGGKFGNATSELANTFTGTLSMLGDKLFNFKKTVAGAGFFDALKNEFKDLNKYIEENSLTFEQIANTIGKILVGAVKLFSNSIKAVAEGIKITEDAIDSLIAAINRIPFVNIQYMTRAEKEFLNELTKHDRHMMSIKMKTDNVGGSLVKNKTTLEETIEKLKEQNDKFTVAGELVKGIQNFAKGFSKSIAEAIVLGKELNMTMKELAQQILVSIVQKTIERLTLLFIEEVILKKLKQYWDSVKQGVDNTNRSLKTQLALETAIAAVKAFNGGGFGFAEGGQVKARADGGGVGRGSPYLVGERGRELFIPNQDGEIISNERLQNLGTSVNFTINATDVKGVKELLIDNRSTIVNIINSALNQKGKAALV